MRQLKYFVCLADLVVTIEGWMLHLAYALGKPFRLLLAPYSGIPEWHPYALSANQGLWQPLADLAERPELSPHLRTPDDVSPAPIHYPEKSLLKAAIDLWTLADFDGNEPIILGEKRRQRHSQMGGHSQRAAESDAVSQ